MRPKEIQEKLGINADRIKFFKKSGGICMDMKCYHLLV